MSDIDDLKNDPNQAAPELIYPADTNGDGEATIGFPADPSARGDGSATTGILHGVVGDDLSAEALETLGQYLGEWTKSNITQVSSNPGTATPIVDPNQRSGQTYHAVEDSNFFSAEAYNWAADAKLTPATQYSDGDHTANTMLRDVVANAPGWGAPLDARNDSNSGPGIPEQTVSAVLKQNRFMQGKPSNMGDGVSTQKYMLTQKHSLATGDSTIGRYNAAADGVALGELSNMAERLLKAAAGEVNAQNSLDSILPSQVQWAPGIPGFNGKVDVDSMRAGAQLSTARADPFFTATDVGTPFPTGGTTSYGQLNHPDETFGGLPMGMIVVAVVSALALAVISLVTSLILDVFGMMGGFPPTNNSPNAKPHSLPLGARHGKRNQLGEDDESGIGLGLFRWMGVAQLKNNYGGGVAGWFKFTRACLNGLLVFWLPQIFFSSGYYAAVHRNALRDIEQVEEAVGNMASGEIDAIAGTFLLIEAFTSSATFRFTNVLISLGDLMLVKGGVNASIGQLVSNQWNAPWGTGASSDVIPANIGNMHSKSREKMYYSRQALRIGNLPLKLIEASDANFVTMPEGEIATEFDEEKNDFQDAEFKRPAGGRFSTEDREALELKLGAYFMPFYFHDLRTNEILPFHCFVENISDSFSPEYSQIKGFGRMDPVQIYKSTTRKIGFSFWVVAQDNADAQSMWISINRLVSMVYPQWTAGDVRTNAEGAKYVMPFSQTVGSGPLIRIRLGNLFHSNVAPKSIKRLFGVGNPELFDITPDSIMNQNTETLNTHPDVVELIKGAITDGLKIINEPDQVEAQWINFSLNYFTNVAMGWDITASPLPLLFNTTGFPAGFPGMIGTQAIEVMEVNKLSPSGFTTANEHVQAIWGEINARGHGGLIAVEIVNYYAGPLPWGNGSKIGYICRSLLDIPSAPSGLATPPNGYDTFESMLESAGDVDYIVFFVPLEEFMWFSEGDECAQAWAMKKLIATTDKSKYDVPDEFFQPENNVVVRAFQDGGGKGLAGVITNLDMDWNSAPWDIDANVKAPQYCKITLGFSPIHDIAPGLSYDGAMRASIYPVGTLAKQMFGPAGNASEGGHVAAAQRRIAAQRAQAIKRIEEGKTPEGLE